MPRGTELEHDFLRLMLEERPGLCPGPAGQGPDPLLKVQVEGGATEDYPRVRAPASFNLNTLNRMGLGPAQRGPGAEPLAFEAIALQQSKKSVYHPTKQTLRCRLLRAMRHRGNNVCHRNLPRRTMQHRTKIRPRQPRPSQHAIIAQIVKPCEIAKTPIAVGIH